MDVRGQLDPSETPTQSGPSNLHYYEFHSRSGRTTGEIILLSARAHLADEKDVEHVFLISEVCDFLALQRGEVLKNLVQYLFVRCANLGYAFF